MRNSLIKYLVLLCVGMGVHRAGALEPERKNFDSLDGHGPSRVNVEVIDWEKNIELHVYPQGALLGLSARIDRTKKDNPVLEFIYKLRTSAGAKVSLYRRALLTTPLKDSFTIHEVSGNPEFTKIILSDFPTGELAERSGLSGLKVYALESFDAAAPGVLGADTMVADDAAAPPSPVVPVVPVEKESPVAEKPSIKPARKPSSKTIDSDNGGIAPFGF